ncbi:hypothetical protein AJ78_03486 [Emergomyces pasteurianus Ep9510]|uniref:Uncharacterized protein n=1 Tax=Emergomyces pasteurianus Ep9510 TaxID=1447872 RepID=A0A1J9PIN7_9EURO|nr:hypothetical protein AJ78_03486 [Emergomyces pasteurianus Ep9510]
MKFATVTVFTLSFLSSPSSFVLGHGPGPSPKESVGCTPHDDHWDCEGPRLQNSVPVVGTSTTPSPTESTGRKPLGDNRDCEDSAKSTPTIGLLGPLTATAHGHDKPTPKTSESSSDTTMPPTSTTRATASAGPGPGAGAGASAGAAGAGAAAMTNVVKLSQWVALVGGIVAVLVL